MMKHSILALVVVSTMAVMVPFPVSAAEEQQEFTLPAPVSVEQKNVDGTEYLIKTFRVEGDVSPELLEEADFELNGFLFTHQTTDRAVDQQQDTKEMTEKVKANSQSKDMAEVIKLFPATMEYNKDGYKGTLTLDTGSIVTEVAGYTNKSYTVSTVKEYPGLMYADPSYVAQSAVKDGYTLPLTDISWVVMGTDLAGDSLVPTEYKAPATYAKTFSSQVPTGYISTARYQGDVTKTSDGMTIYTLTYTGTDADAMPLALKIVTGIVGFLLLGGTVAVIALLMKNRHGADIYNMIDKEYICIGKQAVAPDEAVIDLNEFEDMIQSNAFRFILDKKTTKALFGRNVNVTYKDMTVKHRVNMRNGEYQFDLDLGGVLDVE